MLVRHSPQKKKIVKQASLDINWNTFFVNYSDSLQNYGKRFGATHISLMSVSVYSFVMFAKRFGATHISVCVHLT